MTGAVKGAFTALSAVNAPFAASRRALRARAARHGMPAGPALFVRCMDDETEDVPVLVTLGDEDVPVCEDGSCAL